MLLTIAWTVGKVLGVLIIVVFIRILMIYFKIKAHIARLMAQGITSYPGNETVFGPLKDVID